MQYGQNFVGGIVAFGLELCDPLGIVAVVLDKLRQLAHLGSWFAHIIYKVLPRIFPREGFGFDALAKFVHLMLQYLYINDTVSIR